ncbi:MAG TPA: S9 family peptidase [Anaerolineales bacterium]|nr:S9 family peptidase [Anaerolineales bacterium]
MKPVPQAPKKPHPITQHGLTRVDDYFWLRNREDPDVLTYLQAELNYLEETMKHTKPLQEALFLEMKGRIRESDTSVPEKRGEYLYYTRTEAGKQYPIFCRRLDTPHSPEEILLDQNALAEGKPFCSVSAFAVSPDGKKLAYAVDVEGNEAYTIYIKDLVNGSLYPEVIPNTFGSVYIHTGVEWANDSETIFYTVLDDAKRPFKLFRHRIGTDPSQDVMIFHEEDETFSLYFHKTRDNAYILTHHHNTLTTEMRFLSADQPDDELKVIAPRRRGIEYYVAHHKGTFFIATNENAKNFKLMKTSVSNPGHENWQEILPHRPDVMIEGMDTFSDYLVLYERARGLKQIRISETDGISNVRYVQFPEPVYHIEPESNPNFETHILRFKYSSLVTPHSVIDYHMDTGEWELKKEEEIIGYDKSNYVCKRIHATAPDGAQIPISIVHKKDLKLDGNNPTLLHGYGAYGAILDPEFNSNRISLLDRGFVYAIGHVRGGSDLGREWYENGKVLRKKNSFTDFIACAEHLIQEGFTSKDKLAIFGVSAGGLLVTASMILRPDLFKAVIAKVPFVDVVNSISDPSIPLTTLEYDEWGNPENREQFEYMLSYSPYDNILSTEYPHILLTGGFHDPRVAYWEPAKFAAKLRAHKTDGNLVLLKMNFNAGHAGSSGRYDYLKEVAFEYAFLIDRLSG